MLKKWPKNASAVLLKKLSLKIAQKVRKSGFILEKKIPELLKIAQQSHTSPDQCDQIWRFIELWVTFKSFWQQLLCPNLSHS